MKKLILLVAVCLCSVVILAENVTQERAQQIGLAFLSGMTHNDNQPVQVQTNVITETTNLSAYELSNLYLVNSAVGWVILSNDTRVQPILAYSTTGVALDINDIPDGMADLLYEYNDEIRFVQDNCPNTEEHPQWQQLSAGVMSTEATTSATILERCAEVLWNQSYNNDNGCEPAYNMLCPTFYAPSCGHTYAGCGAVALAQVLWYYKWPLYAHAIPDSISANGKPSSATHSQWYDWDMMPPTLHNTTPAAHANMIATLLRDCGYSIETEYRSDGSFAYINKIKKAFTEIWGYSDDISVHSKVGNKTWRKKIKEEIDAKRPVILLGQGPKGGHFMVVYGYQGDHFCLNWGWKNSKLNNTFFALDALQPDAKDSEETYNSSQNAIFGIKPAIISGSSRISGTQGAGQFISIQCGNITLEDYIVPAQGSSYLYSNTQVRITSGCWFKTGSNVHIAIKDLPCGDYSGTRNAPAAHKSPSIENEADTTGDLGFDITTQIQTSTTIDHIAVYNVSGQLLQTIYDADTDLSAFPSGFYVLQKHMTDGSVVSETIAKY